MWEKGLILFVKCGELEEICLCQCERTRVRKKKKMMMKLGPSSLDGNFLLVIYASVVMAGGWGLLGIESSNSHWTQPSLRNLWKIL